MFEKICIILLVNFVFFFKTLCYKYSSDDLPVFVNPPKFKNNFEKVIFWIEGRYRSGPQVDHALVMLIHALVCVFIYTGFGANEVSFIAALLFALNPVNNQASVWISGRSYAMAALGMTAAMTFPYLSLLFLGVATYYNAGFFSPLVFAGHQYSWFVLLLPILWAIHLKRFKRNVKAKIEKEMFTEDKAIKPEKLILATKTFGYYLTLSLIPWRISFYHSFLQSLSGSGKEKGYSIKDRFFWIGLAALIGIAYYWITVPWNMVSFSLLWFCISIAPFLNTFRMSQEISERYAYLPNVGLMFVLASVIHTMPAAVAAFLAMYATKMWFAMEQFSDDYFLLEHACINAPDSWFAWHVRGMKRWDNKSYQESVIIWTMARMLSPREFKVNFNIATALKMSGHHKEADQFLKIAKDNIPSGQEADSGALIADWEEYSKSEGKKGRLAIVL